MIWLVLAFLFYFVFDDMETFALIFFIIGIFSLLGGSDEKKEKEEEEKSTIKIEIQVDHDGKPSDIHEVEKKEDGFSDPNKGF